MGMNRLPSRRDLGATAVPRGPRLCRPAIGRQRLDTHGVLCGTRHTDAHTSLDGVPLWYSGGECEDDEKVREARYETHSPQHSICTRTI
jgi:hypothetical protein